MIRRSRTLAKASSEVDYHALADFRYQIRRFLHTSEEAARNAGIEPQHHQLLLALKGAAADENPTISWLAERLQLQHNSAVGLVDRLVKKRLVQRFRDPNDQRRALVVITKSGESILHELSLFHQAELRSQASALIASMTAIVRGASV